MKQNKEQKWYPAEYNSTWCIEDIESRDVLDIEQVGKEQAERNARLCASAPQMKELLLSMYLWMDMYAETRGEGKNHPCYTMAREWEELEKQIES